MAIGIVCMMFYVLLALRGQSALNLRIGTILFDIGVFTLPIGGILLLMGDIKRRG